MQILCAIYLLMVPALCKQTLQRHIQMESHQEALKLADELSQNPELTDDAEGLYLSITAYAIAGKSKESLELFEKNRALLKAQSFYHKSLESIALNLFKSHFNSTQEPIKLAALAALSQEPDARVLELILQAFEHPSVKIKMLVLQSLGGFADEKVKKLLLQEFTQSTHPQVCLSIAQLMTHWGDKRILKLLYQKIHEDAVPLEEKIHYIVMIKTLSQDIPEKQIQMLAQSHCASERLLASYLLSSSKTICDNSMVAKLLLDPLVWVKQSALNTVVKRKIQDPEIHEIIKSWKDQKSFELKKGYYFYGLVSSIENIENEFMETFQVASKSEQKILASVVYAAGADYEALAERILASTEDPYIHLELGLYLLADTKPDRGIFWVQKGLDKIEDRKIFITTEPVWPFFVIEDECNSSVSITIGQRRSMDKHMRLKIFHLLAVKKMPEAKSVLKKLLKSDLFAVSLDAMVHYWENFGYEDKDYLKQFLTDEDPEVRIKAALVLNYLDYDKDIRKTLMESFAKQSYAMQIQILFSLSKYNEEDVQEFYIKNLKSKYPLIQTISAGCLFTSLYK